LENDLRGALFMNESNHDESEQAESGKAADVFISTQLLVLLERIKLRANPETEENND
jgi:hypothetical protein